MTDADTVRAVRRAAGLFRLADRGLLEVSGGDRVRWLDGMLTNEIADLAADGERPGCYALALDRRGRIVCDFHVLARPEAFWLETAASAVEEGLAHLDRYLIADDVTLRDASAEWARLAVEGPAAPAVLEAAAPERLRLAPHGSAEVELGGAKVVVAAFALSGGPAFQVFAPPDAAEAAASALAEAGGAHGLVEADAGVLEVLRVEAGIPRLGFELDRDVLPPEARLDAFVSTTKGCFTGQEVVARLRNLGQVKHRLVGLRLAEGELPAEGAPVEADGRRIGEVTSACRSPELGAIALAFVRRPHDEPESEVRVDGRTARVADLPLLAPGAAR